MTVLLKAVGDKKTHIALLREQSGSGRTYIHNVAEYASPEVITVLLNTMDRAIDNELIFEIL